MAEVYLRVEHHAQLPVIGKPMQLQSPMSGEEYTFTPKKITAVRWHPDGALLMDLVGNKVKSVTASEQ